MKRSVLAAILLALPASAAPPSSPLWGNLTPGPHAVGFRLLERYDASRVYRALRDLDGRPRSGERGRPIAAAVWYPAEGSEKPPMTFGDYAAFAAHEDR